MSYQTDISFIKVQKGHRVIKRYGKNIFSILKKKRIVRISAPFQPAGSRTLFDLVLGKFLQFSLRSKRYSLTSHPQLASRELSKEISSTHLSQESVRGYGLQNDIHQDSKSVVSFQFFNKKNGIGDRELSNNIRPTQLSREGCVLLVFFLHQGSERS